jgi:serine O-acetyltransferase
MPCEELDIVWNNIKAEARALADCEPMLASFYHATLLKHENLGSALSYMLANKLASRLCPPSPFVKWWKRPTPPTRK